MRISFSGSECEELNQTVMEISDEVVEKEQLDTLADVVRYVYGKDSRTHRSFFSERGDLAPGSICLINDQDAEMKGYSEPIDKASHIVFISTLHGG
jgi:molybdopterin converting factor small subunit